MMYRTAARCSCSSISPPGDRMVTTGVDRPGRGRYSESDCTSRDIIKRKWRGAGQRLGVTPLPGFSLQVRRPEPFPIARRCEPPIDQAGEGELVQRLQNGNPHEGFEGPAAFFGGKVFYAALD